MRLWTIHPKYFDTQGLLAVWREGLLAQKVLQGRTIGYKKHPQLIRFRSQADPLKAIATYLSFIYVEAARRGYNFDKSKISVDTHNIRMVCTQGQLSYEFEHLKAKLRKRNVRSCEELVKITKVEAHPMFSVIEGDAEFWEVGKNQGQNQKEGKK